jgi:hypothetical protein
MPTGHRKNFFEFQLMAAGGPIPGMPSHPDDPAVFCSQLSTPRGLCLFHQLSTSPSQAENPAVA